MPVPNTFANATATIPLSQLDANFATTITLGNTAIQLGNTVSTLNNMTLANVTVTSGNVTLTNVTVTTANVTTANITTAVIGTANVTTANATTATITTGIIGTANVTTANIATEIVTTSQTLSYGTANGVVYLNGSKVATSGSGLVFDGTNLGVGVTPSAWSLITPMQIKNASFAGYLNRAYVFANSYFDGSNNKYIASDYATYYSQQSGQHQWYNAASGTAGNTISFTQAMTLDASGNLGIGSTPVNSRRLTINTSGQTDLSIVAASNNYAQLLFGYTGADSKGIIAYYNSDNSMQFYTNSTERARISSSGNMSVGTTVEAGRMYIFGDATNVALRVGANTATTTVYCSIMRHESTTAGAYIQFVTDNNVETGRIYDLAGTMQYASSSDARLKTNVQPMQNSLQSVLALNPCTFDMRRGEDTFIPSAGLIAQEVADVYPYVVGVGGEDENTNPWSVDYGKLTPLLVAAIKELKAELDATKAEVALLKGAA